MISLRLCLLCGLCVKDWLFTQRTPSFREVAEKHSADYDTTLKTAGLTTKTQKLNPYVLAEGHGVRYARAFELRNQI